LSCTHLERLEEAVEFEAAELRQFVE